MAEEKTKRKTTISPASPGTQMTRRNNRAGLQNGIDSIFDEFRRSFDDLMQPFFPFTTDIEQAVRLPIRYAPVDLVDNGDSYTVTAELPGFTKDQVNVQVDNEGLSIRAECKEEKEEKQKNDLHRERAYSAMRRYIAFTEEVVPAKVEGSMKEGVLEIRVPKKEPKPEEKPRKVELK